MPATVKCHNEKPEFTETFDNSEFISSLTQAVSTVTDRIRGSAMPIHRKGMYGQLLYYCAIDHCELALRSLGYKVEDVLNQLRLRSKGTNGREMWIRFAGGRVVERSVIFRWPKGVSTRIGVEENMRYLGRVLEPSLWQQDSLFENMNGSFNLWVIGDPTPREFTAWLVFPTQWDSSTRLSCDRAVELCRITHDQAFIDTIIPTNTSDYVIDFDDLSTGTDG